MGETIAVAVHFQDMDVMGEPVEQRAGEPLGPDAFMMPPSLNVWYVAHEHAVG
jgi:hypothetical protein